MNSFKLGIDIGSTTAKIVLSDKSESIIYSDYVRHNTRILETLLSLLDKIYNKFGNIHLQSAFSGSTAMGIAESTNIPFVQEIIAASALVAKSYTGVKSLIDIGGEDAKLVLFNDIKNPDIRMNGNCAGGTGAYIDQMAALLNVPISELNNLAWQASKIYPIASRCGVFAKTDIQNLLSRKINTTDIAASIFEAIADQTINTLARGSSIEPDILFCGGPLTYISYLRESFSRLLKINKENIIVPEFAEMFTAFGTALSIPATREPSPLNELIQKIKSAKQISSENNTLTPLFSTNDEFVQWETNRNIITIPQDKVKSNENCFLGIDSGSTTTKIVIINSEGVLLFNFYKNNNGRPLETVIEGLNEFANLQKQNNTIIHIAKSAVTGYGEEIIKSALHLDYGIVETVAHFLAAQKIEPQVSFILDIGGQDIKAIFVQNNTITNIEINEACSSGCGSFIEGFANILGYNPFDFSTLATQSKAPYDLGSRCTVFMNSKVKQAMRDGATVPDLSAGLAYSVVKNCLNKVLRIKSNSEIGENIVVQGGTFKNKAVFRSLEILSGKKIVASDKPELMGAYGAALYALSKSNTEGLNSSFIGFQNMENTADYTIKLSNCKGCTNNCQVTTYKFQNGGVCFSGNKCEKVFTNNANPIAHGLNIFDYKRQILFNRELKDIKPSNKIIIGIPRVLNIYENYPFWHSLLSNCGFEVVLSDESSHALYKKGVGALMSDNICFPAKLAHGHIVNLIEKKVNRIFLPFVVYEKNEHKKSANSFNCPIVTGYSEVLKNTTFLAESIDIPFDSPTINFNNLNLLKKACWKYCNHLGVNSTTFNRAFKASLIAQNEFKAQIKLKNTEILKDASNNNKLVVLVASHPYHIDNLIHQQVSQILSDLGVNVINEEIDHSNQNEGFDSFHTISQWEYPNRILQSAWWASQQKGAVGFVQLNSFGCGLDSVITDEISDLTKRSGLSFALIRIDEISSPGSIKLRLRSLVESLKIKTQNESFDLKNEKNNNQLPVFDTSDKERTILVPWFSDFYSPFIPTLGKIAGYKIENLPPSDKQSVEFGLENANNEICYPATLVVGDIIRALKSNKYDLNNIAIGITQTGGQCRATNYLALIKRAMVNEGFTDIPIISIAAGDAANIQPGFQPNWLKLIKPAFLSLLFADSLSRMYYASAARELTKGTSNKLKNQYIEKVRVLLEKHAYSEYLPLLREAVSDFNNIQVKNINVKSVGIVGEIYIKYNSFGQLNIIDWLVENNIEVVLPPLMEFFMQSFVNSKIQEEGYIINSNPSGLIRNIIELLANHNINKFEKTLANFNFYRPVSNINHSAQLGSKILKLNNQYGEGWLISAEIASFAEQQINHVICLQPFGCIANHIVGKGMELKIKSIYPNMNLLYLDFDSGVSKVNILNRLHFLIQNINNHSLFATNE